LIAAYRAGTTDIRPAGQRAAAYLADTSAACPLLSAMASARGITLEALCQRVLAKREAFSAAAGSLLGSGRAWMIYWTPAIPWRTFRPSRWNLPCRRRVKIPFSPD
jgi:hypothetical protein